MNIPSEDELRRAVQSVGVPLSRIEENLRALTTDHPRTPHPLFVEPWVAVERSVLVELLREAAALVSVKTDDDALVSRLRDMAREVERGERDGLSLVEWLAGRGGAMEG